MLFRRSIGHDLDRFSSLLRRTDGVPSRLYVGLPAMNPDEPPPAWHCLADEVEAVLTSHPEFDIEDAIEALIWGEGENNEDQ